MFNKISVFTILSIICACVLIGVLYYLWDGAKRDLASVQANLDETSGMLQTTQDQLIAAITELSTTKTKLSTTEAELNSAEFQLESTRNQLVITERQLSLSENQLSIVKADLEDTKNKLLTAKSEKSQMLSQYNILRNEINVRLGATQKDRESFITPKDPLIAAKVQEIVGSFKADVNQRWSDYQKLYNWVTDNIEYSRDSYTPVLPEDLSGKIEWIPGFWRTPAETLQDGTGDCEDMALLLFSMLRDYWGDKYTLWMVTIHSDLPEYSGHIAVAFPVEGGKLTILDPAGHYMTEKWGYLTADPIDTAVKDWLAAWSYDMPGAVVDGVMDGKIDKQFSSTAEFLAWVKDR